DDPNVGQFSDQLIGILAMGVFTFVFAFLVFYVLKVTMGIRVDDEEEEKGLDIMEHEMRAYS
ncbi:MAG: ammonium transporter, partial [Bacteroidota bacterium]